MLEPPLCDPWLVAVWPGMGHVAVNAGFYLMSKLGMQTLADLPAADFFEVEHVEVAAGLVQPGRLPRNRLFLWRDPQHRHDLVLFLGEAQPAAGKSRFCRNLIEFAKGLGVRRVFTFAAMATQMHPSHESRTFAAATDEATLSELRRLELKVLEEGHIGGLNGVLLGVAAESGLSGGCLLGEMPHVFAQLPFPKASLSVLQAFVALAGIELDLAELAEQGGVMERRMGQILEQVERSIASRAGESEESDESSAAPPAEEPRLAPEDERHIERLFHEASRDRAKAYELKQELDRLGVFRDYEDRFLDLFRPSEGN